MSDNSITVELLGAEDVERFFGDLPDEVHDSLVRTMDNIALRLWDEIVFDKLNGGVLNRITGKLADSVVWEVQDLGDMIEATISAGGPEVPYAGVHEYGGIVNTKRTAVPQTARALQFADGEFRMYSRAHDIPIPERSYLRSTLADQREMIITELQAAYLGQMAKHFDTMFGSA